MVHVVSVPCSGTRFTGDLLADAFGSAVPSEHVYDSGHITEPVRWVLEGHAVVVPLRDPVRVLTTQITRGIANTADAYRLWVWWDRLPNVHFFRVDTEDRAAELEALSEFVGLHVSTEWEPVGSTGDPFGIGDMALPIYRNGRVPPGVVDFFVGYGYEGPWTGAA